MAKNSQFMTPADRELKDMTFKSLQKAVIVRGYPFEEVSKGDHGILASFFVKNFNEPQRPELLAEYDNWLEDYLKKQGKEESFLHPQLRYSYVSPEREEKVEKRVEKKEKKPKKEKTADGIYKGTKKALTFKLAKEGMTKEEVMEKVLETFPDASVKSMGIWYNKALKEIA